MSSARMEEYLRQGRLVPLQIDDEELAGRWEKALRAYVDAQVPGLSAEGAFVRAYDAALMLATAVVNAAGYRVKSQHHHKDTFDILRHLGYPELEALGSELDSFRRERNQIQYDPETRPSIEHVADLQETVRRLISTVRAALVHARPSLELSLQLPPGQVEMELRNEREGENRTKG